MNEFHNYQKQLIVTTCS